MVMVGSRIKLKNSRLVTLGYQWLLLGSTVEPDISPSMYAPPTVVQKGWSNSPRLWVLAMSNYNLRKETCFKPKINTMRFKNSFINRLVFNYELAILLFTFLNFLHL